MIFKAIETTKGVTQIKEFANQEHIQFKTAQILMQRGIDTHEKFLKYTKPTLNDLRDPFLLQNMKECHERIELAIKNNESILLFGDYDVDGISAVAILYKFLKDKVTNLNYFLPNRYEDGYGLTIESCKKVIEKFNPTLIITVDCGISAVQEVDFVKSNGIDIIITDHHEMQEILPNTIVVDPKVPNQQYGFDGLCGAGVAMKVVETFVGRNNLDEYLPICAIATVSDIVPLIDENRAIVKLGFERQSFLPEGIKMLLHNLKIDEVTSQSVSFKIAPKLNASGRMGNAYHSLYLYISNDTQLLKESIKKVGDLNALRQKLSQDIYDECLQIIKENRLYTERAIILKSKNWDSGLLGIACARLVDEFYKPIFLFSEVDGELKGSVRSVDAINIHQVLSCCNSFLETFGGHSMAAGLSLKVQHFDEFKEQIFQYLNNKTTDKCYMPIKTYDVAIKPEEVTLDLANELELLEPVGCENPNPLFMITYKECYASQMQNFDSHINISIKPNLKFVAFNANEFLDDYIYSDTKQTIFELQTSEWKGKKYLKGVIKRTLFSGYGKNLQEIASGRLIKQYYPNQRYDKYIDYFEDTQTKELLDKLLSTPSGTVIVIYNYLTYEKFKNILNNYQLNQYIGGSQSKFEENCIVFALDDIKSINLYKNVVFLDLLQRVDFLNGFDGEVFAVKNQKTYLPKLDFSRETFGQIFNAIKNMQKQEQSFANEIEYYLYLKRNNPHISNITYSKFVCALYTFAELGILSVSAENGYFVKINESIKSALENSSFYNNLRFISKIN